MDMITDVLHGLMDMITVVLHGLMDMITDVLHGLMVEEQVSWLRSRSYC